MEQIFTQFGLPIATAIYFIKQYVDGKKEHLADIKSVVNAATSALEHNSQTLEKNTEILDKAIETIESIRSRDKKR